MGGMEREEELGGMVGVQDDRHGDRASQPEPHRPDASPRRETTTSAQASTAIA
jgi:hypothetical protein